MDIFKLGLRHILGLALPGFIVVMTISYCLFEIGLLFNVEHSTLVLNKDQQFLIFSIVFALSYIFGAILRLRSADKVDDKSSEKLLKQYDKAKKKSTEEKKLTEEELKNIQNQFLSGNAKLELTKAEAKDFDNWIWRFEQFPYHSWEFRKFKEMHPPEMFNFYYQYKDQMLNLGHLSTNKEFFNYCKMVVINSGNNIVSSLKEEVLLAEATVRFYAGTYFALKYSKYLIIILALIQFVFAMLSAFDIGHLIQISKTHVFGLGLSILFIIVIIFVMASIHNDFRRLRLKEVDTLYDAFYLVHRHPENCENCSKGLKIGRPKK